MNLVCKMIVEHLGKLVLLFRYVAELSSCTILTATIPNQLTFGIGPCITITLAFTVITSRCCSEAVFVFEIFRFNILIFFRYRLLDTGFLFIGEIDILRFSIGNKSKKY